jgi:hypothetical protein
MMRVKINIEGEKRLEIFLGVEAWAPTDTRLSSLQLQQVL